MSAPAGPRMPFRQITFWASTLIAAGLYLVPGVALVARVPHFTEDMAHLGYPTYFLPILGIGKMLGAITILAPRLPQLKEWAYAGMMFDTLCAAASRLAVGDETYKVIVPFAIAAVIVISWALRPPQAVLGVLRLRVP